MVPDGPTVGTDRSSPRATAKPHARLQQQDASGGRNFRSLLVGSDDPDVTIHPVRLVLEQSFWRQITASS